MLFHRREDGAERVGDVSDTTTEGEVEHPHTGTIVPVTATMEPRGRRVR